VVLDSRELRHKARSKKKCSVTIYGTNTANLRGI
jgi:hypothetical protein